MKYLLPLLALIASCDPAYADVFRPWGPQTQEYSGTSSAVKPTNNQKAGAIFRETDTFRQYRYTGDPDQGTSADWVHLPEEVTLGTAQAGERAEDSTTGTDYTTTAGEWAVKAVAYNGDLAARTIYNGPCLIAGIQVTTAMSANASQIESGGTSVYPIAASTAAGMYPFPGPAIFETDCVWDPGSLSAGAINVWYRPLGAGVTWAP